MVDTIKFMEKCQKAVSLVSQIPNTARLFSSSYVDNTISSLYSRLKSTKISMGKLAVTIKKTKSYTTLKKASNSIQ